MEMSDFPLRTAGQPPNDARPPAEPSELLVRRAEKDGRTVAVLRALQRDGSFVVEAEVFPEGGDDAAPLRRGPYAFPDAGSAVAFVTEATEALTFLGCDVRAG